MLEMWCGSYSKLALFEKCPRAYFYRYKQKLDYTTPALEYGKKVHEQIAKFLIYGEVDEEFRYFITPRVKQLAEVNLTQENIERRIEFRINGFQMTGILDVVTDSKIIDWKTNWNKDASPRQLQLYAYGAKQAGLNIQKAFLHYLRYSEDVEVPVDDTKETIDWTKRILEQIANAEFMFEMTEDIEEFPKTNDTVNCLSCPYRVICHGASNQEDARRLAKEIEELESVLELKKEALKNYIEEFGEVTTDRNVWRLTTVNNWNFDTAKVYEYITKLGKDPLKYMNVTLTSLKKLKLSEDELYKLGENKITLRLTKSKVEGVAQ